MDKQIEQAHPFELNTGKTIQCTDMQQVIPTFQKRSALYVVLTQRVGNIPILSILSLYYISLVWEHLAQWEGHKSVDSSHTESQVLKTPFKHTEIILHSSSFSVLLIRPYLFSSFTWWVRKNTRTLLRLSIIIVAFEHKIRHTWYLLINAEICAQVLYKRFSLKVRNQVRQILCEVIYLVYQYWSVLFFLIFHV